MDEKQKLIVMDIDGTFADSNKWQKQYFTNGVEDEEGYHKHLMDFPVNEQLLAMATLYIIHGYKILFLSARPEKYYRQTVEWFTENVDRRVNLFDVSRRHNCYLVLKPDTYIDAEEWKVNFLNGIQHDHTIEFCIDDNPKVCEALRQAGYMALQMESLY